MTRTLTRLVLAAATALVTLLVAGGVAAPVQAAAGGNSANAKLCQKGGWQHLYTSTGATFASQDACVGYGAQGGAIATTPPPPSAQSLCAAVGWTFQLSPAAGVIWWCQTTDTSLEEFRQLFSQVQPACLAAGGSTDGSNWVGGGLATVWCLSRP